MEEGGVHPRHADHVAGVDGVGPELGGVDGGDAGHQPTGRRPGTLAGQRRAGERGEGGGWRQVVGGGGGGGRRGGHRGPDGAPGHRAAHLGGVVRVPEVLHLVGDGGATVLTRPLGEPGAHRRPIGRVGEGAPQRDGQPDEERHQDDTADRQDAAPPVDAALAGVLASGGRSGTAPARLGGPGGGGVDHRRLVGRVHDVLSIVHGVPDRGMTRVPERGWRGGTARCQPYRPGRPRRWRRGRRLPPPPPSAPGTAGTLPFRG